MGLNWSIQPDLPSFLELVKLGSSDDGTIALKPGEAPKIMPKTQYRVTSTLQGQAISSSTTVSITVIDAPAQ